MKNILRTSIVAALVSAPLMASAGHNCPSGMKYPGNAYYGPPEHPMRHHPMHPHKQHMMMHKMMWYKKHKGDLPAGHPMKKYKKSLDETQGGDAEVYEKSVEADAAGSDSILDTAASAGSFNTLIEAIKAAELVDTLNQTGPFTVFAPTDEAFEKVPDTIRNAILADKQALVDLLTYHVVPGKVTAADAANLDSATTVQGTDVSIDSADGVKVDGARVVAADISASNGIIHAIDSVLIPN